MTRRAMRRARELREQWLRELAGITRRDQAHFISSGVTSRGSDYADASDAWVCNRKKAYHTEEMADKVAGRMTERNLERDEDDEFYGVEVHSYTCGRCGRWHIGR